MSEYRIFIGSSSESRHAVGKIQQIISEIPPQGTWNIIVRPWYANNVFTLGDVAIEAVEREASNTDLAIFVLADDDELIFRHSKYMCPRDNVIFEAGLFMGKLGRKKVFLLIPANGSVVNGLPYKQLSDLAGLTVIPADIRDLPGGFSREVALKIQESIVEIMNNDPRGNDDMMSNLKTDDALDLSTPIKDYSKIVPKSLGGAKQ